MSGFNNEIVLSVRTGDVQHAGTDANVAVILHDIYGSFTEKLYLDNFFKNDFERGNLDVFEVSREKTQHLKKLHKLELFRDNSGFGSAWFVERITVENRSTGDVHIFPVFRWLRPHYHYIFKEYDTCLPQDDDQLEQRKLDLEEKKKVYVIDQTDPSLPAKVKELPADERFSSQYRWDIKRMKYNLIAQSRITVITTGTWENLDDVKNVYTREIFNEPKATKLLQEDWFFGYQRLNGLTPNLIRLCTQIPDKLAVKNDELAPFLEGKSVVDAIAERTLFICDLDTLHNFPAKSKEYVVCAPVALLYKNSKNQLLPIAIQLFQQSGPLNPVFFPSDDKYTWLLAKMWYNQAEASYHQALTHLGYTHLMMEGFALALHRNVSISHPIFKLVAPHLLYLLAINKLAVEELLSEGGWIDKTMSIGRNGVLNLVRQRRKDWKLDVQGTLPEDMKNRGVYDEDVLPGYYYRDDALLLYRVIHKYVHNYVNLYYESASSLVKDTEIQAWGRELVKNREDGGMGLQGIPGKGEFKETGQLIQTLTSILFTSSVQHAAVNFPQYDYYGFPAVFALSLRGTPPTDKRTRTDRDVIDCLPDKAKTFDSMIVTKILSRKGVKSLGDFEVQYVFDPKAKKVVEQFRDDLRAVGTTITQRNSTRHIPYEYLHPDSIPNSISI